MILDLFAGSGGWDQGTNLDALGLEIKKDACDTARAAGHAREQLDIALARPRDFAGTVGLLASPPCQGFSSSGLGKGRTDSALLMSSLIDIDKHSIDARIDVLRHNMSDNRSLLVLEPLRYALHLEPEWLAWEQVPAVQCIWDKCKIVLEAHGYSVSTGTIRSEQYGVPQTRRRSILVASRTKQARLPEIECSRHYSRDPERLDGQRWKSMRDALNMSGQWHLRASLSDKGTKKSRNRSLDEPAQTITGRHSHAQWTDNRSTEKFTLEQASLLQTFPADYPWIGSMTSKFFQVGDAMPPLWANKIVSMLL